MAKKTSDFSIQIGERKPRVNLRRSAVPDDETTQQAVDKVARNPTSSPPARAKTTAPKPKTTPRKPSAAEQKEKARLLANKRLTIDIPFYLHDALREHNFRNRSTTKDIINDYLHQLLKVKDIRPKK